MSTTNDPVIVSAVRTAVSMAPNPRSRSGLLAKSAVGVTWVFISTAVRSLAIFESESRLVPTTGSHPITRSAEPSPIRVA